MSEQIGVVIPCYNEYKRLDVSRFTAFLETHAQITICFVNDGSSDDTITVLNQLKRKFQSQVMVLDNAQNMGKAESVRKGLNHFIQGPVKFEMIGFLDADLSTSLEQFYKLCIFLREHSLKAVFGSRIKRLGSIIQRSPARHYIGRVFATLIGKITKLPIYDSQCGAKVFEASYLPQILLEPFRTKWLFDVELILRMMNVLGPSTMTDKVYEYPLDRWIEVGDSKISSTQFARIPLELLTVYKISLKK